MLLWRLCWVSKFDRPALFRKCHELCFVVTFHHLYKNDSNPLILKKGSTALVWAFHLVFIGRDRFSQRSLNILRKRQPGLWRKEMRTIERSQRWMDGRDKNKGREDMKAYAALSASSCQISLMGEWWKGGHIPRLLNLAKHFPAHMVKHMCPPSFTHILHIHVCVFLQLNRKDLRWCPIKVCTLDGMSLYI